MPFRRRRDPKKELPKYELAPLRDQLDVLAQKVASNSGVKLDYSPKSVKKIETMLGTFHDEYSRTGNDEGLNGIAMEFAAYIIKVIELNFEPGTWSRNHPTMGPDSFRYHWREQDIFPFAWCQKRIFDGPADDVWAKFNLFILNPPEREEASG